MNAVAAYRRSAQRRKEPDCRPEDCGAQPRRIRQAEHQCHRGHCAGRGDVVAAQAGSSHQDELWSDHHGPANQQQHCAHPKEQVSQERPGAETVDEHQAKAVVTANCPSTNPVNRRPGDSHSERDSATTSSPARTCTELTRGMLALLSNDGYKRAIAQKPPQAQTAIWMSTTESTSPDSEALRSRPRNLGGPDSSTRNSRLSSHVGTGWLGARDTLRRRCRNHPLPVTERSVVVSGLRRERFPSSPWWHGSNQEYAAHYRGGGG